MIRTQIDLAAIDRELELFGHVRPDVPELVARYSTARSTPPARADEASEPPDAAERPASAAPASGPPIPAFASAGAAEDEDEDHDEFELLVDDEEIERVDDDLFEPAQ